MKRDEQSRATKNGLYTQKVELNERTDERAIERATIDTPTIDIKLHQIAIGDKSHQTSGHRLATTMRSRARRLLSSSLSPLLREHTEAPMIRARARL